MYTYILYIYIYDEKDVQTVSKMHCIGMIETHEFSRDPVHDHHGCINHVGKTIQ